MGKDHDQDESFDHGCVGHLPVPEGHRSQTTGDSNRIPCDVPLFPVLPDSDVGHQRPSQRHHGENLKRHMDRL
jgi:hypothetical protein